MVRNQPAERPLVAYYVNGRAAVQKQFSARQPSRYVNRVGPANGCFVVGKSQRVSGVTAQKKLPAVVNNFNENSLSVGVNLLHSRDQALVRVRNKLHFPLLLGWV